ncbi:MAG: 4-hydroxy-tetrahydrodipicolinate synthase [Bacteroidota bacterium]
MAHIISQKFRGTGVALVTPFNNDNSVDFNGLKKLVNFQIDNGIDYLVVMGTTGESPTVSSSEKQQIIDCVKEANNGRLPLMLGMGSNNTLELVEALKKQDFSGFSVVLSVSPYYNKPNQNGIVAHYTMVADASPLPVLLYNVPGRTGSNISTETTLKLAAHPNIFGTKEASGNFNQCMEIIQQRPADFAVISGDDAFTLPFIAMGMDGVISVMGNGYPRKFSSMVKLALEGKIEAARVLHYELLDAMNLIFADGSPGGIKVLLEAQGICGKTVRMPLHDVSETVKQQLLKTMDNAKAKA